MDHRDNFHGTHFFPAAGSELEMKDKQIQTETSETEHKDVQVGSIMTTHECMHFSGVYTLKELNYETMHGYQCKIL